MLFVIYRNVLGVHLNMYPAPRNALGMIKQILSGYFPSLFLKESEVPRMTPTWSVFVKLIRESGYMHLQASKPDTIGNLRNPQSNYY